MFLHIYELRQNVLVDYLVKSKETNPLFSAIDKYYAENQLNVLILILFIFFIKVEAN